MISGSNLKNAAIIRRITHLKTEVVGGIRWESKSNVLTNYSKIKEAFQQLEVNNESEIKILARSR